MPETSMQSGSTPTKTERRAHPRQRIQSLTYVELGNGNGGIALNVSEGGMTVVAAQPLDAEGTLDIALQLPQTRKRLQLKGEVRWLSDSRKEAGFQFIDLSSEALADIRDWMAREASPQPVDEKFAPLPTYREPPRREPDASFFVDEEEVEEETIETLPAVEAEADAVAKADADTDAAVKAYEAETTSHKLQRVFEAGHREMEAEAAAEEIVLEPLPRESAAPAAQMHASAETLESAPAAATNGSARRTPFSSLASESGIDAPGSAAASAPLETEGEREADTAHASSRLFNPATVATTSIPPLELPRPVFGSGYRTDDIPEETGKDIRVHLQSGWVLGVLVALLALISFFAGMAVRRGALNRMVGDGEPYGNRTGAQLTPGSSPAVSNPAAGPAATSAAASKQIDIDIVDSANRKWTIPMVAGGSLAPLASAATETPAPLVPADNAANSATQTNPASSQPQTSAVNPPAPATPATNNTKTTSNADLSDATTSDSGNGGLMLTLPETPVAASSSIAISVRRFIPIPPEAAARNRNLQVGSLANLVEPAFPAEAAQQSVEGIVKLRATFADDGSVRYLDAESGPKVLMPNALTAVRNWRYNPTLLNGKPIETQEEITIVFRLPR
jgi:hypothetical protein